MKPIKTIDGTWSTRFPLGLHVNLQSTVYTLVKPIAPAKLLLEESDITTWNSGILEEMEIDREAKKAEETAELQKKDDARDEIASALIQEIRLAAKSPIVEKRAPGKRLKIVVDTYKGITRENLASETAHIKALLNDLDKPAAVADLATLGLTPLVQKLRTYNNEFIALQDSRLKAGASINLPPTAKMRAKNDATATEIFRHIEAAYITTATDEDRKTIGELIDRINKVLQAVKTTYRQSLAQKRAAAEKKPKDPKKPKEPKDPKKPKEPKDPKKPEGGGDDIQIPSEPPKKPGDAEQPTPKPGGEGGGDDIQIPSEPPKKPDGQ